VFTNNTGLKPTFIARTKPSVSAGMPKIDVIISAWLQASDLISASVLDGPTTTPALLTALEGFVARLRLGVSGIEAGKRNAAFDLGHDPGLETLLLDAQRRDFCDQRLRNDHGAVGVRDDDVAREHRDAAASDRFLPVDEG